MEKEMPRETLERIAAQLGSLDGEPLQACPPPISDRCSCGLVDNGTTGWAPR